MLAGYRLNVMKYIPAVGAGIAYDIPPNSSYPFAIYYEQYIPF
jgi:hypothetical protein